MLLLAPPGTSRGSQFFASGSSITSATQINTGSNYSSSIFFGWSYPGIVYTGTGNLATFGDTKSPTQPSPDATLFFPESSAVTVRLPEQPEIATVPWIIDPVQDTWLEVVAEGLSASGESMSFSSRTGYNEPYQTQQRQKPTWDVQVRWFWNDQPIPSITEWAKNGSYGKWGTYRAEVWDVKRKWYDPAEAANVYPNPSPPYHEMTREKGWYKDERGSRLLGSLTFQVKMRGHEPLAAGAPPVILDEPPEEVVLDPSAPKHELVVRANAGEPFSFGWADPQKRSFTVNSPGMGHLGLTFLSRGPSLEVNPAKLSEAGTVYQCWVYNAAGEVKSRDVRVRWPRPPKVTVSLPAIAVVGKTLVIKPTVISETPCTYAWSGPALNTADAAERVSVAADGTLLVSPVRLGDGGYYQVRVTNAEGPSTTTSYLSVVQFPPPMVVVREGEPLPVIVQGPGYVRVSWKKLEPLAQPLEKIFDQQQYTWTFKKTTPDVAGNYKAEAWGDSRASYERLGKRSSDPYPGTKSVSSDIVTAIFPSLKAQQPEFTLPPGRVRAAYDFQPPVPATLAATGTRFSASGLPRGLKVAAGTGRITGRPEQSGDFKVRFTAANSKGSAAVLNLLLHIDPLPSGVAGTFVIFGGYTKEGDFARGDLTVTTSGSYTLKGYSKKPIVGLVHWLSGDQIRIVDDAVDLRFQPEKNRVVGTSRRDGITPVQGWRQVWSRLNPATAYLGRYHFEATLAPSPPPGLRLSSQGTRHGACTVSATGQTVVTYFSDWDQPAVTTAFLGPDGDVLLQSKRGRHLNHILQIDSETGTIGASLPSEGEMAFGPALSEGGFPQYSHQNDTWWHAPYLVALATSPLIETYAGRRYQPYQTNQLLPGFFNGDSNVLFQMGVPGVTGTAMAFATLTSKHSLKLPKPAPDTWHATARLNRTSGEVTGTVCLSVPTKHDPKTGALIFTPQTLPYHAYLIPLGPAGTEGYRISGFVRTQPWRSGPDSGPCVWPLTSIPISMHPGPIAGPPDDSAGSPGGARPPYVGLPAPGPPSP